MIGNGKPKPAGPYVRVLLLDNGSFGIEVKGMDPLNAARLLTAATSSLLSNLQQQAVANDAKEAGVDPGLAQALEQQNPASGTIHRQLLRILGGFLAIPGVDDDIPGTVEEQRQIVVEVREALKIQDEEAAQAALPIWRVLGNLLMVTRLKRTRGRIAMARATDERTPSQCVSDILEMRAQWREMLKSTGEAVEFPDEEA